jgi:hypothetical protein
MTPLRCGVVELSPSDNDAQQILAAANSGQLTFDPATGEALLNTLNHVLDELDDAGRDLSTIVRPTKLGRTDGAQVISQFNEAVAVSGARAFAPAHKQFRQSVATVAQAVRIAMDNYTRNELRSARSFRTDH